MPEMSVSLNIYLKANCSIKSGQVRMGVEWREEKATLCQHILWLFCHHCNVHNSDFFKKKIIVMFISGLHCESCCVNSLLSCFVIMHHYISKTKCVSVCVCLCV